MVNAKFILIRVVVIIIALFTAYAVYNYILKPGVLEPMCLINSNGCVHIGYYTYNNSALIHMRGTGIWIWFNGDKAFIYGQPVGQLCKEPSKYEAAYAVNTRTGLKEGFECVMILNDVIQFYKNRGIEMQYIVKRVKNPIDFTAYDVLNILDDEGVIDLSASGA